MAVELTAAEEEELLLLVERVMLPLSLVLLVEMVEQQVLQEAMESMEQLLALVEAELVAVDLEAEVLAQLVEQAETAVLVVPDKS